jgi:hypothetical protein
MVSVFGAVGDIPDIQYWPSRSHSRPAVEGNIHALAGEASCSSHMSHKEH